LQGISHSERQKSERHSTAKSLDARRNKKAIRPKLLPPRKNRLFCKLTTVMPGLEQATMFQILASLGFKRKRQKSKG
jgi:hypothetical protein